MAYVPPLPRCVEVKRSLIEDAGMGLFATRKIPRDKRIGVYRGTILSREAADLLPKERKPYLMEHLGDDVIDGYRMDNHMRWANHSYTPNAYAKLYSDGVIRFISLRRIRKGEEIYIDYGYDPTIPEQPPMHLGPLLPPTALHDLYYPLVPQEENPSSDEEDIGDVASETEFTSLGLSVIDYGSISGPIN